MKSRAGSPVFIWVLALAALFSGPGCNLFQFIDSPSGDEQLLSAARACFDRGDFECASRNYALLSSALSDTRAAEEAFLILDRNGVGMGAFMGAFSSGTASGGTMITRMANAIGTRASETTRLALLAAYQKTASISDSRTRGFVRFVTSLALAAEILAEDATGGILAKNDLVADSDGCIALGTPGCAGGGACLPPGGKATTTPDLLVPDLDANPSLTGSPTINAFQGAIEKLQIALGPTELAVDGSSALTFAAQFGAALLDDVQNSPCYRYTLITSEIGASP